MAKDKLKKMPLNPNVINKMGLDEQKWKLQQLKNIAALEKLGIAEMTKEEFSLLNKLENNISNFKLEEGD